MGPLEVGFRKAGPPPWGGIGSISLAEFGAFAGRKRMHKNAFYSL